MTQPVPSKTKQKKDARDIRAEALKLARSIKTENQAPAETKAIANGIQRGIEIFLRQQSEKTRELDKRSKKVKQLANQLAQQHTGDSQEADIPPRQSTYLPWALLAASWIAFAILWVVLH